MKTFIQVHPLHWDMFRNTKNFKEKLDNLTGAIRIAGTFNSNLIFEDRYHIKLKTKATEKEFEDKVKDVISFVDYSIKSIKQLNSGTYKNIENEITEEFIRDLVMKVNHHLFTRWVSIIPFDSKWKSKEDNSGGFDSFKLIEFRKEFGKKGSKKRTVYLSKFNSYDELYNKMLVMCDRYYSEVPRNIEKVLNKDNSVWA